MKIKPSEGFLLTVLAIIFIFGYFQGVVVPNTAAKYGNQAAVYSSQSYSRAVTAVLPCSPSVTVKCGKLSL